MRNRATSVVFLRSEDVEEQYERALEELKDVRRQQLASLLPHSLVFGFNVIPVGTVSAPTIALPPEDFKIFEELYNGPDGDAVRALITSSDEAPAHPPKGATSDAGNPAPFLPSVSEVPGE